MSLIATRFGYGNIGIVEVDYFTRILNNNFTDNEEVRCDHPTYYANACSYVGVAEAGSLLDAPVWNIVRISYDGEGVVCRKQFRRNVVWDNRTTNWI